MFHALTVCDLVFAQPPLPGAIISTLTLRYSYLANQLKRTDQKLHINSSKRLNVNKKSVFVISRRLKMQGHYRAKLYGYLHDHIHKCTYNL